MAAFWLYPMAVWQLTGRALNRLHIALTKETTDA